MSFTHSSFTSTNQHRAHSRKALDGVCYFTLSEAKTALMERVYLRQKVEAWWEEHSLTPPSILFKYDNIACFTKPAVATRRYEDVLFLEYAQQGGFTPTWMVYTKGVLSTESPFKRRLLHPTHFERHGKRHGGMVVKKHKLGCIEKNRTKSLSDVVLDSGMSLVEHHRKLHDAFGLPEDSVVDLSPLYAQFDYVARKYQWAFLSMFIAHAVLVDDYHGGEEGWRALRPFTEDVFLPAYRDITRKFGLPPIIVRFPWHEHLKYTIPDDVGNWRNHKVIPEKLLDLSHHFC